MAIGVYPIYSPCREGGCKFPSPILVLDTRGIIRFVGVRSSAAAMTEKNGARILRGTTYTMHPQKKEWVKWTWEATGYLTPHGHYHWETMTICGDTNKHEIFDFSDVSHNPAIKTNRCAHVTEPHYIAIFVLECLIALETKDKEFIRNDMTLIEPVEPT